MGAIRPLTLILAPPDWVKMAGPRAGNPSGRAHHGRSAAAEQVRDRTTSRDAAGCRGHRPTERLTRRQACQPCDMRHLDAFRPRGPASKQPIVGADHRGGGRSFASSRVIKIGTGPLVVGPGIVAMAEPRCTEQRHYDQETGDRERTMAHRFPSSMRHGKSAHHMQKLAASTHGFCATKVTVLFPCRAGMRQRIIAAMIKTA
ncbi:hypothetical protein ACVW17_001650 [Bradyrhizobium sp. USDA 4473]